MVLRGFRNNKESDNDMPIYTFDKDKVIDFTDDAEYPCKAYRVEGEKELRSVVYPEKKSRSTFYGYADKDSSLTILADDENETPERYNLKAGMYFSAARSIKIRGSAVVIERLDYEGLFSLGGAIEEVGRLKYIDGCSDTLLISPPKIGDPCLNHLHFPTKIDQTMHTHPTVRIGIVAKGKGKCKTPDETFDLYEGLCWYLPVDGVHGFETSDESTMDIIAWHPDSDTGPTDEDHPMINRTYVDGTSARHIDEIKTQRVR